MHCKLTELLLVAGDVYVGVNDTISCSIEPNHPDCPEDNAVVIVLFAVYMMMTNVLLLNLLIAMFRYNPLYTLLIAQLHDVYAYMYVMVCQTDTLSQARDNIVDRVVTASTGIAACVVTAGDGGAVCVVTAGDGVGACVVTAGDGGAARVVTAGDGGAACVVTAGDGGAARVVAVGDCIKLISATRSTRCRRALRRCGATTATASSTSSSTGRRWRRL